MVRRLFTLLSALSLVLFVGTCVMWVRSYGGQDILRRKRYEPSHQSRRDDSIMSSRGSLWFSTNHVTCSPASFIYDMGDDGLRTAGDITLPWIYQRGDFNGTYFGTPEPHGFKQQLGIHSFASSSSWTVSRTRAYPSGITLSTSNYGAIIRLRFWVLATFFLIIPVALAVKFVRRSIRRKKSREFDHCPACGYDLRATPDRCPECGTVPMAPKAKA